MAEFYVRPPLVAREPANPAVARWRYRAITGVLLLAVFLAVALLLFQFLDPNADPGVEGLARFSQR